MKKITHLLTEYGEKISGKEYDFYPRPSLVRDSFFSLNGEWALFVGEEKYDIAVPYPPESLLSGVNKVFKDGTSLLYEKRFSLPSGFARDRVILHFGAIDGDCSVYLNDSLLGVHIGGYDAFCFDITDKIQAENTLRVEVIDKLKGYTHPYGKQSFKRGGMWYTPVSGIWQSVWLEGVPREYIKGIRVDTSKNTATLRFDGISSGEVELSLPDGKKTYPITKGVCKISVESPIYWSPESPHLYYFTARCGKDEVKSYFALRTLEIKEIDGISRLCLNGEPYFFNGVLDQGYFSDGIYTPASPKEYEKDILAMKRLGFNTLRKHIKVEPEEFYYQCDRLGMVVFQDMVNNGKYSFLRDTAMPTVLSKKCPSWLSKRAKAQKQAFISSMEKTVNQLYNHPSICYWTIFNEGWGQFESDRMYFLLKELDSSRFVDSTSGWFKGKISDVESLHVYFKKVKIKPSNMPIVLSEFGGYSYKESGHVANERKTYGYKFFGDREKFENAVISLYENEIIPLIPRGLCGAIYTQLSDVEDETNGFLTYDRKVLKVNEEKFRKVMEKVKI